MLFYLLILKIRRRVAMLNFRKVNLGVFLILLLGIAVVGIGFVFMSCGKDAQWKIADSDRGQYAVDFSLAPGSSEAPFGVGYGTNMTNMPRIKDHELTVEAWVKSRSDNLTGAIFGRMDKNGVVLFVKNNEPKFAIRREPPQLGCTSSTPTSTECIVESNDSLLKDVWVHLAGVLTTEDQSSGPNNCSVVGSEKPHIAIYVNGQLKNCATTGERYAGEPDDYDDPNVPGDDRNFLITIGLMGDGVLDPLDGVITTKTRFDGVIDEVRLWRVARTQAQIQACMNQELSLYEQGDCYIDPSILIGYWRLNEGKGYSIFDSSGTGTSGRLESPPLIPWDGGWVEGAPITKK